MPRKRFILGWFVSMTDDKTTAVDPAGKTNKFVVQCDTWSQAKQVQRMALTMPQMHYVNISEKRPGYTRSRYTVVATTYAELGENWKKDYGKNQSIPQQ